MTSTALPALDAHRLRADFAVFEDLFDGRPVAFLDSAASTQKPRQVLDRMRTFYEHEYANVHRGVYRLAERATEGFEGARRTVAGLLNAPSEKEIVFTRSATEAINLIAYAWGLDNLGPGDVVVITELEHHSNFVPWQYIAHRTGASFRNIPIDDLGELQLDALDSIAREGNVKLVANNLVSNTLGTINPVETLAAWAHEQGAIMVVDAAQAAPHRRVDVQALDADFVAISSHKLCGPSGIGALWGKRELLEKMSPFNLGGEMIRSVGLEQDDLQRAAAQVRGGHAGDRRGGRLRSGDRLHLGDRPRRDRAPRARARRAGDGRARRAALGAGLRAAARASRRNRVVRRRGDPPARRGANPRLGGRRRPRRPSLHPASDDAPRRLRHHPGELLPLLDPRGDRPADSRSPQGQGVARLMSEFEQLYREVILDHYKAPRNHGVLEPHDAIAEGQNPLCGDEVTVSVRFGQDDVIEDVGFEGRGCAISQAATSMLTDIVKGRTAQEVSTMPKEELLDEIGIPLTPVRLKCALLGLGVLKVALHRAKGTALPDEWGASSGEIDLS